MARKVRDYRAEEQRRRFLANTRGYNNRYQLRRAIETGVRPPIQPKRVRSRKTIEAQERRMDRVQKAMQPKPRSANAYDRAQAYDWSDLFAKRHQAEYVPERAAVLGKTRHAYTKAYIDAFIGQNYDVEQGYSSRRYIGGSEALRYWFVELNQYYTQAEYDARYHIRLGY